MKICVCHVKSNRPLFTFLYNAFVTGLQRQKIKYVTTTSSENLPKDCDHYFLFTNTLSKTQRIVSRKNVHTFYISPLQKGFNLKLEQHNSLHTDDTLVYIESLNRGYIRIPENTIERFDFELPLEPWKQTGKCIVLPEQIFPEGYVNGFNLQDKYISFKNWAIDAVAKIREVSELPIVIASKSNRLNILQNHPSIDTNYNIDVDVSSKDAISMMSDAAALATLSSKSVFEYIINGVPCFIHDTSSLAYDVCGHNLDNIMVPKLFDRYEWLARLSHIHFSISEIKDGSYIHEWSREVGRQS